MFSGKRLKYNVQWEDKYQLRYSPSEVAAYCSVCIACNTNRGSNTIFITNSSRDRKNAAGEKREIISKQGIDDFEVQMIVFQSSSLYTMKLYTLNCTVAFQVTSFLKVLNYQQYGLLIF